jgi:hypothetical protein
MNESERLNEWLRHYEAATLKFNALRKIYESDGERMLTAVLKRLGLSTAADVVKTCDDCQYLNK